MSERFREFLRDNPDVPREDHRALARDMTRVSDFGDGRTKQEYKDECDINFILAKASRTGVVSHLSKYEQQYGDLQGVDLQTMYDTVAKANTMFTELPAEVRREFGNDQQAFFNFVNDPANKDILAEKLPALAKPGNQLPQVDRRVAPIETSPTAKSSPASTEAETAPKEPEKPAEAG